MAGIEDSRVEEGVKEIKLKFNDYWRTVPRTGRKKNMNMEIRRHLE